MSRPTSDRSRWLAAQLRRERRRLGIGAAAMALRAGAMLLLPWPLKFIVDNVIFRKPLGAWASSLLPDPLTHRMALLHTMGVAMLVLGAVDAGLAYVGNRLLLDAAQRIGFAIRQNFFAHLQRLPLDFHRRHLSGELASRIGGDVNALQNFIAAVGIDLLPHLLTIAGILGVMLAMNWRYGLLTLAVAPVLTWIARHFATEIRIAARKVRKCEGEQSGATQEVLGNVQLVQAFSRESHEDRRFGERGGAVLAAALQANRVQSGFAPTMNLAIAVATGLIAWYGAALVIRGRLTPGDLLVFLAYLRAIAAPARQLAKAGRIYGRAAVALERIDEYRSEVSSIAEVPGAVTPSDCAGLVELKDVSFGYGAAQTVVREVSFELRVGQTVALIGPTGSGKSTIASLVARFHDPDFGQILLDGRDLREISLRFVRTRIALVPQDPLLFHAPIWANIAYGRDGATRRDAIQAAIATGVDEVISSLPGGYELVVGERGSTLSGGQRQCIAVARAMLSDAAVVILDEPSSSMDGTTEQRLMHALQRLAKDRAALLIAHRLATVASADLILVLDRGRIVQRGSHEHLLAEGGVYASLWQASGLPLAPAPLRLVASS
ncbi:MAG TPA: ABC transporter ATP-binding protein [Steroidobacteraceae bacterium]|nr:ABC transporter ATP-binding protein [Steroidobacteraceae bacterium]